MWQETCSGGLNEGREDMSKSSNTREFWKRAAGVLLALVLATAFVPVPAFADITTAPHVDGGAQVPGDVQERQLVTLAIEYGAPVITLALDRPQEGAALPSAAGTYVQELADDGQGGWELTVTDMWVRASDLTPVKTPQVGETYTYTAEITVQKLAAGVGTMYDLRNAGATARTSEAFWDAEPKSRFDAAVDFPSLLLTASYTLPRALDAVTLDLSGQVPAAHATPQLGLTAPEGEGYFVARQFWMDANGNVLGQGGSMFEPGNTYRYSVLVETLYGYSLQRGKTAVNIVGAQWADTGTLEYSFGENSLGIELSYTVPKPQAPAVKKPSNVTLKKVTGGKKRITVKWKAVSGAKYQVRYKIVGTSKWKTKNVAAGKTKLVIKKLATGKKYAVKIRAYKKVDGKVYYSAKWSKTKKSKRVK